MPLFQTKGFKRRSRNRRAARLLPTDPFWGGEGLLPVHCLRPRRSLRGSQANRRQPVPASRRPACPIGQGAGTPDRGRGCAGPSSHKAWIGSGRSCARRRGVGVFYEAFCCPSTDPNQRRVASRCSTCQDRGREEGGTCFLDPAASGVPAPRAAFSFLAPPESGELTNQVSPGAHCGTRAFGV